MNAPHISECICAIPAKPAHEHNHRCPIYLAWAASQPSRRERAQSPRARERRAYARGRRPLAWRPHHGQ